MRPLAILIWGAGALVAVNCGARTPFDDSEPGATGGASGGGVTSSGSGTTTNGSTGTSGITTGPVSGSSTGSTTSGSSGVGGFGTATGSSGVTTGGVTTSGTGGVTTSGGTTTGGVTTGGVTTSGTTVGVGGARGTTTTGAGGFGGRSGTGGAGGRGGRSGTGGGIVIDAGSASNPLLSILPRVRPTPQCNLCVDLRCNGTSACSSDPACLAGTQCYFTACTAVPDNAQLPCALKCFNGNVGLLMTAFEAVSCVYGACGFICTGAREP